jgi:hypothetical protein
VDLATIGLVVGFWVVPVLITSRMGRRKDRAGIWWGFFSVG